MILTAQQFKCSRTQPPTLFSVLSRLATRSTLSSATPFAEAFATDYILTFLRATCPSINEYQFSISLLSGPSAVQCQLFLGCF